MMHNVWVRSVLWAGVVMCSLTSVVGAWVYVVETKAQEKANAGFSAVILVVAGALAIIYGAVLWLTK